MNFKAIFGAVIVASLIVLSATAATGVPGWVMAGSEPKAYEMGIAETGGQARGPAAFLQSTAGPINGFGTMMQMFDVGDYAGKRVRFSGAVRSEAVKDWAGLWLRVDGENNRPLAFDNMQRRPIKGTAGWQRYDVVLDVAPEAKKIAMGVLISNSGKVWLDDVKFEVVPASVATTNMPAVPPSESGPKNLGFARP